MESDKELPEEVEKAKELIAESFLKGMNKLLPKLPFKIKRNQKCFCGSGKKFKHCCIFKYQR